MKIDFTTEKVSYAHCSRRKPGSKRVRIQQKDGCPMSRLWDMGTQQTSPSDFKPDSDLQCTQDRRQCLMFDSACRQFPSLGAYWQWEERRPAQNVRDGPGPNPEKRVPPGGAFPFCSLFREMNRRICNDSCCLRISKEPGS